MKTFSKSLSLLTLFALSSAWSQLEIKNHLLEEEKKIPSKLAPISEALQEQKKSPLELMASQNSLSDSDAVWLLEKEERFKALWALLSTQEDRQEKTSFFLGALLKTAQDRPDLWRSVLKSWQAKHETEFSIEDYQTIKNNLPLDISFWEAMKELNEVFTWPADVVLEIVQDAKGKGKALDKGSYEQIAKILSQNYYSSPEKKLNTKQSSDAYLSLFDHGLSHQVDMAPFLRHIPAAVPHQFIREKLESVGEQVTPELRRSFLWSEVRGFSGGENAPSLGLVKSAYELLSESQDLSGPDLTALLRVLENIDRSHRSKPVEVNGSVYTFSEAQERFVKLFQEKKLDLRFLKLINHHSNVFDKQAYKNTLEKMNIKALSADELKWWIESIDQKAHYWSDEEISEKLSQIYQFIQQKNYVEQLNFAEPMVSLFSLMLKSQEAFPEESLMVRQFFETPAFTAMKVKTFPKIIEAVSKAERPFQEFGSVLRYTTDPAHGIMNSQLSSEVINALENYQYPYAKTESTEDIGKTNKVFKAQILSNLILQDHGLGAIPTEEFRFLLEETKELSDRNQNTRLSQAIDESLVKLLEEAEKGGGRAKEFKEKDLAKFLESFELFDYLSEEARQKFLKEHGENLERGLKNIIVSQEVPLMFRVKAAVLEKSLFSKNSPEVEPLLEKVKEIYSNPRNLNDVEVFQKTIGENNAESVAFPDALFGDYYYFKGLKSFLDLHKMEKAPSPESYLHSRFYKNFEEINFSEEYSLEEQKTLFKHFPILHFSGADKNFMASVLGMEEGSPEAEKFLRIVKDVTQQAGKFQNEEAKRVVEERLHKILAIFLFVKPFALDEIYESLVKNKLYNSVDQFPENMMYEFGSDSLEQLKKFIEKLLEDERVPDDKKIGLIAGTLNTFYDRKNPDKALLDKMRGILLRQKPEDFLHILDGDISVYDDRELASFWAPLFVKHFPSFVDEYLKEGDSSSFKDLNLDIALGTLDDVLSSGSPLPSAEKAQLGALLEKQFEKFSAEKRKGLLQMVKRLKYRNLNPLLPELRLEEGSLEFLVKSKKSLSEHFQKEEGRASQPSVSDWSEILKHAVSEKGVLDPEVAQFVSPESTKNFSAAAVELLSGSPSAHEVAATFAINRRLNNSRSPGHQDEEVQSVDRAFDAVQKEQLTEDAKTLLLGQKLLSLSNEEIRTSADIKTLLNVESDYELSRLLDFIVYMDRSHLFSGQEELLINSYLEKLFLVIPKIDNEFLKGRFLSSIQEHLRDEDSSLPEAHVLPHYIRYLVENNPEIDQMNYDSVQERFSQTLAVERSWDVDSEVRNSEGNLKSLNFLVSKALHWQSNSDQPAEDNPYSWFINRSLEMKTFDLKELKKLAQEDSRVLRLLLDSAHLRDSYREDFSGLILAELNKEKETDALKSVQSYLEKARENWREEYSERGSQEESVVPGVNVPKYVLAHLLQNPEEKFSQESFQDLFPQEAGAEPTKRQLPEKFSDLTLEKILFDAFQVTPRREYPNLQKVAQHFGVWAPVEEALEKSLSTASNEKALKKALSFYEKLNRASGEKEKTQEKLLGFAQSDKDVLKSVYQSYLEKYIGRQPAAEREQTRAFLESLGALELQNEKEALDNLNLVLRVSAELDQVRVGEQSLEKMGGKLGAYLEQGDLVPAAEALIYYFQHFPKVQTKAEEEEESQKTTKLKPLVDLGELLEKNKETYLQSLQAKMKDDPYASYEEKNLNQEVKNLSKINDLFSQHSQYLPEELWRWTVDKSLEFVIAQMDEVIADPEIKKEDKLYALQELALALDPVMNSYEARGLGEAVFMEHYPNFLSDLTKRIAKSNP